MRHCISAPALLLPLVILMGVVVDVPAQTPRKQIESVSPPERDHRLFVGLDLIILTESGAFTVRRLEAGNIVAEAADGQIRRFVDTAGYRFQKVTKIAPFAAQVDGLETKRVHSMANDVRLQRDSQQLAMMDYVANRMAEADRSVRGAEIAAAGAELAAANARSNGFEPTNIPSGDSIRNAAISSLQEAVAVNDQVDRFFSLEDTVGGDGEDLHDGLVHEFSVSSPQPLAEVEAVFITRIRDPQEKILDFVYGGPIGPVGPKARRLRQAQFGLPTGFEVIETELHLYSRGEEVASNLSERSFPLSAEEARQFVLSSHLADHRGESVDGAVVWSLAPKTLRTARNNTGLDREVQITVDATGSLVGIADEGVSVTDGMRTVIDALVYLPPLENGEPVAGVLTVNPADYFR